MFILCIAFFFEWRWWSEGLSYLSFVFPSDTGWRSESHFTSAGLIFFCGYLWNTRTQFAGFWIGEELIGILLRELSELSQNPREWACRHKENKTRRRREIHVLSSSRKSLMISLTRSICLGFIERIVIYLFPPPFLCVLFISSICDRICVSVSLLFLPVLFVLPLLVCRRRRCHRH